VGLINGSGALILSRLACEAKTLIYPLKGKLTGYQLKVGYQSTAQALVCSVL